MDRRFDVLCYTGPHHEAFFRRLCGEVFGEGRTAYVSDFPGAGDIRTHEWFYGQLRSPGAARLPAFVPDDVAEDMAWRCRFLRRYPPDQQRRLLGAMITAMDAAIERVAPDLVVSRAVDCYVLDALRFCSRRRGIPFLGMTATMVNGYFMLTARGEHNTFRQPSEDEARQVLELVEAPRYRPAYLPSNASSSISVAKRYLRQAAKAAYFPMKRVVSRDPYNLYFAGQAAWARETIAVRNLAPGRFFDAGWAERAAQATGPVLYLPLQFTPECNADYWCQHRDFLLFEDGVQRVVDRLAPTSTILVKEHPQMVGYRATRLYEALRRKGAVLVPPGVPSLDLMDVSDAVLSWSGSAGIEAVLLRDTPVLDFGEPYYVSGRTTRTVRSAEELGAVDGTLAALFAEAALDRQEKIAYVGHFLSGYLPGGLDHIRDFSATDPIAAAEMASVVESLAANVGRWFAWAKVEAGTHHETVA